MSVFIVIDSAQQLYECKLIDLVSFDPLPAGKEQERDQGLIKGTLTLIGLLENILEDAEEND